MRAAARPRETRRDHIAGRRGRPPRGSQRVEVSGSGQVHSITRNHLKVAEELDPPYYVALVALDEGPILLSRIVDDAGAPLADGVSIGDRVTVKKPIHITNSILLPDTVVDGDEDLEDCILSREIKIRCEPPEDRRAYAPR